ncbi:hypothetical protein Agub_g4642 [Astrephomene gubernaculifera]|uniref:CRAL-TRIO domain-containing protein n=1 Tax=Astrephomene gubernaculifera TaxID=47775 RepID=A0AAD3HJE7_9CHLO|nr:hypothetical protein Agub_g4642 [Astrephomene gubernaculifera]
MLASRNCYCDQLNSASCVRCMDTASEAQDSLLESTYEASFQQLGKSGSSEADADEPQARRNGSPHDLSRQLGPVAPSTEEALEAPAACVETTVIEPSAATTAVAGAELSGPADFSSSDMDTGIFPPSSFEAAANTDSAMTDSVPTSCPIIKPVAEVFPPSDCDRNPMCDSCDTAGGAPDLASNSCLPATRSPAATTTAEGAGVDGHAVVNKLEQGKDDGGALKVECLEPQGQLDIQPSQQQHAHAEEIIDSAGPAQEHVGEETLEVDSPKEIEALLEKPGAQLAEQTELLQPEEDEAAFVSASGSQGQGEQEEPAQSSEAVAVTISEGESAAVVKDCIFEAPSEVQQPQQPSLGEAVDTDASFEAVELVASGNNVALVPDTSTGAAAPDMSPEEPLASSAEAPVAGLADAWADCLEQPAFATGSGVDLAAVSGAWSNCEQPVNADSSPLTAIELSVETTAPEAANAEQPASSASATEEEQTAEVPAALASADSSAHLLLDDYRIAAAAGLVSPELASLLGLAPPMAGAAEPAGGFEEVSLAGRDGEGYAGLAQEDEEEEEDVEEDAVEDEDAVQQGAQTDEPPAALVEGAQMEAVRQASAQEALLNGDAGVAAMVDSSSGAGAAAGAAAPATLAAAAVAPGHTAAVAGGRTPQVPLVAASRRPVRGDPFDAADTDEDEPVMSTRPYNFEEPDDEQGHQLQQQAPAAGAATANAPPQMLPANAAALAAGSQTDGCAAGVAAVSGVGVAAAAAGVAVGAAAMAGRGTATGAHPAGPPAAPQPAPLSQWVPVRGGNHTAPNVLAMGPPPHANYMQAPVQGSLPQPQWGPQPPSGPLPGGAPASPASRMLPTSMPPSGSPASAPGPGPRPQFPLQQHPQQPPQMPPGAMPSQPPPPGSTRLIVGGPNSGPAPAGHMGPPQHGQGPLQARGAPQPMQHPNGPVPPDMRPPGPPQAMMQPGPGGMAPRPGMPHPGAPNGAAGPGYAPGPVPGPFGGPGVRPPNVGPNAPMAMRGPGGQPLPFRPPGPPGAPGFGGPRPPMPPGPPPPPSPYPGLLYSEGRDTLGRPVVVLNTAMLPSKAKKADVLQYVLQQLRPLVEREYVLVVLSLALGVKAGSVSSAWALGAYRSLAKPYRKNVKHIVLVQPSAWARALLALAQPFVSKKAAHKVKKVDNLVQIAEATGGEVKLESLGSRFVREIQYGLGASPLAGLAPPPPGPPAAGPPQQRPPFPGPPGGHPAGVRPPPPHLMMGPGGLVVPHPGLHPHGGHPMAPHQHAGPRPPPGSGASTPVYGPGGPGRVSGPPPPQPQFAAPPNGPMPAFGPGGGQGAPMQGGFPQQAGPYMAPPGMPRQGDAMRMPQ